MTDNDAWPQVLVDVRQSRELGLLDEYDGEFDAPIREGVPANLWRALE